MTKWSAKAKSSCAESNAARLRPCKMEERLLRSLAGLEARLVHPNEAAVVGDDADAEKAAANPTHSKG